MNLVSNELTFRGWPVALVPINESESDLITPRCEVFPLDRKWQGSVFGTFSSFLKFISIVRSWKPDVLVLNCDLPELYGAFLPKKLKIVIVEHTSHAWFSRKSIGKMIRLTLRFRQAKWVAVSSHLRIWPGGDLPRNVLQNSLAPSLEVVQRSGVNSGLKRLIYIGRLSPEKQPKWMLEIGHRSQTEILIIGDGSMRDLLQEEAIKKEIKATFSGYVLNPWALVQQGDLLIVPSAWEGDGLVVIEGLEKRIPLLLSDIPDFRRFGLPEANYCKTEDDFVARVNQFHEDLDQLVVSEKITKSILASRSPEVVGEAWEAFLMSI
jgi:glycosyltransferase involved in cell wall biosynthesis